MSLLLSPLAIDGRTVRNRLWVSPMCQYSATDGLPGEWHHVHLAQFASGGAGLVIAEASAVVPEGRISPGDTGLWNDAQRDAWAPIVAAIHSRGAAAGIQLAHAGRKASTWRPFDDERGSVPVERGGWATVAPSAIAFDGYAEPAALDTAGIERLVTSFADAARRADEAGFDLLEVHAAHGYLLHQFLSPLSNHRDDEYGGSLENRARLLLRVVEAVRDAAPGRILAVRFSATDWADGGWHVDETATVAGWVGGLGARVIDISTGGLVAHQRITTGPGYQVPFAATVRERTGLLVTAVGEISDGPHAERILQDGLADAVMVGRGWLRDPHFALRAAAELADDDAAAALWPPQYVRARPRA
ncbi:NADH:flavin oxidoreductase/NADH oxidase [Microbacterium sp. EYE_5]|uniref:NADH:flavin oxidoreductase/NADH oxidase n=1 Tax=unclassified Microbacterium TaxID=2609290 RepID=UPI0020049C31|nr:MULTISPECIES: NADH:flavin oxidoreductase/NADH oxidase [unclassified Microbacterium]MCK6081462.1 NADH:flavin oxidoreductase/NADH oxidase [Microbacterium sp. EYE_382]MCK6086732.1 NADH:flavin oxidoreductase/NADH oxidase [Microbacterium sp. EYE_384]MCK6123770.1 NADH:flavin oxidoreductase/NADH oxidase [Microbacterium sp. EYE_80]MCK6126679.1 NADH:flavin oxidoreductase/NADH oxidase [Microbacterium sp. EYE_79]MCK6142417.1 NADH:flavin oxidoreductase/NADH oxidase [Microbacterium sp. EYE_39]